MKIPSIAITPSTVNVGQTFTIAVEVFEPTWEYYKQFTWEQLKDITWGEMVHKSQRPFNYSDGMICGQDYRF